MTGAPVPAPSSLLLGAASLDIYLGRELVLPGGGVLNMAWHLRDEPDPWHLLTRVGDDRPEVFLDFLARHVPGIRRLDRVDELLRMGAAR